MTSIYKRMYDAISNASGPFEVIILGSNDAAGSSRWRLPKSEFPLRRYDALAEQDSDVVRALVHIHEGVASFHEVEISDEPPDSWIRGISSLRPQRNAQNLRSGSVADKNFISDHHRLRSVPLTPLSKIGTENVSKFFILDLEGIDFDVSMRLLNCAEVLGFGCEFALMTDEEVISLRCEAVECGFWFDFSDEDALFMRSSKR